MKMLFYYLPPHVRQLGQFTCIPSDLFALHVDISWSLEALGSLEKLSAGCQFHSHYSINWLHFSLPSSSNHSLERSLHAVQITILSADEFLIKKLSKSVPSDKNAN